MGVAKPLLMFGKIVLGEGVNSIGDARQSGTCSVDPIAANITYCYCNDADDCNKEGINGVGVLMSGSSCLKGNLQSMALMSLISVVELVQVFMQ